MLFRSTATTYSITFDSDGGSTVASQSVTSGSKVAKPSDPVKTGNTFSGWTLNGSVFDFATSVTSDLTLKASWTAVVVTPTNYTVTFDANGGTSVASQSVTSGGKVTKPTDPTNSPHNLVGWYNGTVAWDFNSAVTSDLNLKASWTSTVSVADTVRYDSTCTYVAGTSTLVQVGYVVLDLNAGTYTNYWISQSINGTVTYQNASDNSLGVVKSSGTFAQNSTGLLFSVTSASSSSDVGKAFGYTISGDQWTWVVDTSSERYALSGFGNYAQSLKVTPVTPVTKTVLTSHAIES